MCKQSRYLTWLTLLGALALSGCGADQPVAVGTGIDDAISSGVDGSALADGGQADKDASPPGDVTALSDTSGDNNDGKITSDGTVLPGQLGGACKSVADCPKGSFCAAQGSADAYCSAYGCTNSSDCAGIPSSDLMCCVNYPTNGQSLGYCLKQPGATQCGKQDQPVGASCVKGGQSDCSGDGANWCFQSGGGAVCVQGCTKLDDPTCATGTTCNVFPSGGGGCLPFTPGVSDGSPCASDPLGGCGKYAFCIQSYTGDPLSYCATACTKDAECATGLSCFIYDGVQGICQHNGGQGVGQSCAGDRFSCAKGLYCVGFGTSAAVCSPSCAADSNCTALGAATGSGAYCVKSAGNAAGVCYPAGAAGNGGNCAQSPYACAEGLYCIGGYDGYDPGAFCQQDCTNGSACPANATCTEYSKTYSGCQPNGTLSQGGDCQGDPTLCKAGEFCLGAGSSWQCLTQCTLASAGCPASTWCVPYGQDGLGVCWPTGTKPVGSACVGAPWSCQKGALCSSYGVQKDSSCLENCDGSPCPGGFSCDDFGDSGHWCQPVGGGEQGASCSLTAACVTGSVCVGQDGPAAFCAKPCAQDSDCPSADVNGQKLWCAKGKWGGYCVPDGGIQKNGSCFQQPWACAKGLVCLGDSVTNPGAFCAQACTGFASVCASGEKCQYLGGGDAYCFATGTMAAGDTCLQDPLGCAPDTLCIKGTPEPMCIQQCGVGFPGCPADSPCTSFVGSAVKLCVPNDFIPFGTIILPF